MDDKRILKLEKRRKIYNYILKNPGVHLSELSKKLDIPKTTLFYHLNYLKKHELVLVKTVDRFSRYYGISKVGEKNKKIFVILRQEIPCKIMLYLILHKEFPSQVEISKHLRKHPTTISYHLDKLMDVGLVRPIPMGNKIRYRVNCEHEMYEFFIEYSKCLLDEIIPFATNWWEFIIQSDRVDKIIELVYEVLPHPYHV